MDLLDREPAIDVWDFRLQLIDDGYCPECLAMIDEGASYCPICNHDVLKEIQDDQKRWTL